MAAMAEPTASNPFDARFASLNRRPAQQLMLVVIFGFVAILSVSMLAMALRADVGPQWLILRLLLGEFLIAWLVADHVTGILAAARKSGEWQEWRLIPQTAQALARGLVVSTRQFVWIGIGLWAAVEIGVGIWVCSSRGDWWVYVLFLATFHGFHLAGVGHLAGGFALGYASASGRMGAAWIRGWITASTIWGMMLVMGGVYGMVMLSGALVAAPDQPIAYIVGFVLLVAMVLGIRFGAGDYTTKEAANAFEKFLAAD